MQSGAFLHEKDAVFIAGHHGMVGSAIHRLLQTEGFDRLITRTRGELDLTDQGAVSEFFNHQRLDVVVLAAARVGGIEANRNYPADFIYQNLMIASNVIQAASWSGVERLLFLGSSCIYPKHAPQPMTEEMLLSGYLEPTNEPYAVAKIAGIKLCESYNRQFGTDYRAVMPTNLYGPDDNFDLENSHVLPALIRKYHLARLASERSWEAIEKDEAVFGPIPDDTRKLLASCCSAKGGRKPQAAAVRLWGSGSPRRELLHVDDLAAACLSLMNLSREKYQSLCASKSESGSNGSANGSHDLPPLVPHINIGSGNDVTIRQLANLVKSIVGYEGKETWDTSKPDGTERKLLDISRLRLTGWKPRITLEDGIRSTYDWYRNQLG